LPPLVEGIPQSWLYQGLACQQVTVYDIIMVLKEVVDFYRDGFNCIFFDKCPEERERFQ
jgi:hypothetical protein